MGSRRHRLLNGVIRQNAFPAMEIRNRYVVPVEAIEAVVAEATGSHDHVLSIHPGRNCRVS